jgi:hypothetical protein
MIYQDLFPSGQAPLLHCLNKSTTENPITKNFPNHPQAAFLEE